MPIRIVEGAAGAVIVIVVLFDVFNAVVVPRPTRRRLSPATLLTRTSWRAWRATGVRMRGANRREQFLGVYAPTLLVALLVMWIAGEIVGYGLLIHALNFDFSRAPSGLDSLYIAGSTILTLGTGDFSATGSLSRMVMLLGAASGLGTLALVISLLFNLYANFQQREALVVTLDARAGAPPSGITLLETHGKMEMIDGLGGLFAEWERWSAEVLDTHLAYPILAYFRSSHDNESWVAALGAVLDAATLVVTSVERVPRGPAWMMIELGNHLVEDLAQTFGLADEAMVGVEREEFDDARRRLEGVGYALGPADAAWQKFAKIRSRYAYRLNALAQYWEIPPAQWIADRGLLRRHH